MLDNEVELFWKKRWNLAKCLFLWNRFHSLALNISTTAVYLHSRPSYNSPIYMSAMSVSGSSTQACDLLKTLSGASFIHWQDIGGPSGVLLTHIILELRLYAMYGSTRKMLFLFTIMTAIEAAVVFSLPLLHPLLERTNQPSPGVYICTTRARSNGSRVGGYWYAAVLIVETILLGFALAKAWQYRSSSEIQSPLMKQLTRDSLGYFLMLFWIYLANLVIWARDFTIVAEFGIPFGFALPSILANRLLIRIRATYFRSFPEPDVETYLPPLRFTTSNVPSSVVSTHSIYDGEPAAFNERLGI
ncbi:hypothetical protein LshimejAT787_0603680 [Lyophyllum shimeji]|uniref:DUF6533 domain-containing protein n=1 Tax=Lyophyllum shimeji TaxID=47721 RepID=A0A9P3UQG6_LYOSH|nr:hypothetical protein LshimejAT787_0603680 [Lyophyllum shimeji]